MALHRRGRAAGASGHLDLRRPDTRPKIAKQKGEKARIVELRLGVSGGAQTIFPGSTHAETGEPILWEVDRDPLKVPFHDIVERVQRVAAAALLRKYWPASGLRHDAALALGGTLGRAGWDVTQIKLFVEAVAGPRTDHPASAADSVKKVAEGGKAFGLPRLRGALRATSVVAKVAEWLGLREHGAEDTSATTAGRRGKRGGRGPDLHAGPGAAHPVLEPAALHGLAGAVVEAIAPHSEADPAALLLQFLAAFGACCGRRSYAMAEADRHPPQIWPLLVGGTSRGPQGLELGTHPGAA